MVAVITPSGTLATISRPSPFAAQSIRLADDLTQTYGAIWKAQPAVRTCVSFLARNIASLGLPLYRRTSDTDRARVTDHPLAALLSKPAAGTTRYRWIDTMVHDLAIYDAYFAVKVGKSTAPDQLIRVPKAWVSPVGGNWLAPDAWKIKSTAGETMVPVDRMIHIHGYNPDDARDGSSPIESLRRILAEEYEAGRMREQVLRNGARMAGYLKRPAAAPEWSDNARARFRAGWKAQYSGGGPEAGGTPILEDGMEFVAASQNAEQLQYIEARKLTREEVASAYFIPPPMVGILDHATFSNITEQHKNLYQDTLGPWLEWIQAELEMQLMPDFDGTASMYLEFNLAEKLKGTPEEQATQLQTAVGGPWLTRNEARARQNLPAIPGGDELITPLNVVIGGQASPSDSAPKSIPATLTRQELASDAD